MAGKDDPIYKQGLQIFKPVLRPTTKRSDSDTAGTKPHPNEENLVKQTPINEQPPVPPVVEPSTPKPHEETGEQPTVQPTK